MSTKICNGPAHERPTALPISEFYIRRSKGRVGEPMSRCKLCCNWNKLQKHHRNHGTIPYEEILPALNEVINRIGFWNAVREIGCSDNTLVQIRKGNHARVQKQTAARIILVLQHLRKNGIAYHKKDIQIGIHRVKKLRTILRPYDQYGPIYPELENEFHAREAARKREERKRLKEAKEFQQSQEQRLQDLTGY